MLNILRALKNSSGGRSRSRCGIVNVVKWCYVSRRNSGGTVVVVVVVLEVLVIVVVVVATV